MSGFGAGDLGEPEDQPPVWVAFVTVLAAVTGVVIAIYIWGALT